MTMEERFQRIEDGLVRWIALAAQDRAEYIAWKRDMQSHVEAAWIAIERYAEENRKAAEQHNREMADMRQQMAARDEVMDQRITGLVSAIGELIGEMREKK